MSKHVHVIPYKGDWRVKIEGNKHISKSFEPPKKAIDYERTRAVSDSSELLIHGKNGQIREKNSDGNDPKKLNG